MYFLYGLLLVIAFVLLLPRFLYDALTKGKYAANFSARFGRVPAFETQEKKIIWLHCVSVGETQAARPLVSELLKNFPDHALVVSTTTITGQKIAREVFKSEASAVFYFPFDFAFAVRKALDGVQPSLVLIMETELWPRFLRECEQRKIPTAIVNGRLSEKSLRGYSFFKPFIKRVVNTLSLALMQSDADAKRISSLGIAPEKVCVTGNIKFDAQENINEQTLSKEFRARFGFNDSRPLIIAASTHAPEESFILEAFSRIYSSSNPARLLIAPRHPERFNEVADLIQSSGLNWTRRTNKPKETDAACDVILLDSIGELRAVYPLARIVFVGGSLIPKGGHSILEPAATGVCVITGAHTSNFSVIVRDFLAANALIQLPRTPESEIVNELVSVLNRLLTDTEQRNALAKNAKKVFEKNRGATQKTIEALKKLI